LVTASAGLKVANVAIATGHAVFGALGSFVLNLFSEFRCSSQTLGKTALYFTHVYKNFIRWNKSSFSFCLGN